MAKWVFIMMVILFGAVGCAPPADGDGETTTDDNVTMVIETEANV